MSDAKFTPGPWEAKPCISGGCLLVRGGNEYHQQKSLQIVPTEDAQLIAAAPDLYAALDRINRLHRSDSILIEVIQAREALSKARGENPDERA